MKAEYQSKFGVAVMAKVKQAEALGSKTTWTTRDHLAVLAELLTNVPKEQALDVLTECYNVSAFQQTLAKVPTFKAKGHFQREGAKGLSDIVASLEASASAAQG